VKPLDPANRRNLFERAISAVVLLPIAIWLTSLGGWPFAALVAVAAGIGAYELLLMFGRPRLAEWYGAAVAAGIPLTAALHRGETLLPGWATLALAFATMGLLGLLLFTSDEQAEMPARAGRVALAWLYCGLMASTLVGLRLHGGTPWVVLAFVVTWANDTFAYFAGMLFGKHKLYARISPKKTWEGFAGGALGSVLGALVVRSALLPELPATLAVLLGAGAAVLGPVGDFTESLFKRAAGVKDSGKLIPGHGGLLDRIDALLFVVPWVYLFVRWLG
jgi:phosphatidate cytidylyltransferase